MRKKSIDYLIPKLTVFSPFVVLGLTMIGAPVGVAMVIWAGVCLALLVQNKIERKRESGQ